MLLLQSCHFTGRFLLLNTLRGTIIILRMSVVIPSILPNVLVAVVEVAALMESFHMELQMLALGELLTAKAASVNNPFHMLTFYMLLQIVPLWINFSIHKTRPMESFGTLPASLLHDKEHMYVRGICSGPACLG